MLAIHAVHRRLAELTEKGRRIGYGRLNPAEQRDILHCLEANACLVRRLDELKNLAFIAHLAGDFEWEQDICRRIDELEVKML